jgi:hypothetical protein
MAASGLKRFMLAALLWLPLMFFFWFWLAGVVVWPVIELARLVLLKAWPQVFTAVSQGADALDAQGHVVAHVPYLMQLSTTVLVDVAPGGAAPKFGFIEPTVNPMVYGYSLPLFVGLVMATPLRIRQRLLQCVIGVAAIVVAQAFGAVSESLKVALIDTGPPGLQAAANAGLSLNLVALCYQFGYLILPSLLPAVMWIAANRAFIEALTRHGAAEPETIDGVESRQPGDG